MDIIYPPYPVPFVPRPTADNPSQPILPGEEFLPVIDETGFVTGRMTRRYAHGGSHELHPVVHLQIINRNEEVYLQKRSMKKDLLPGYWDTAVGGHVDFGEQVTESLYREAAEELGFYDFNPVFLMDYIWESPRDKEFVNVFACVGNFDLHPDSDEVEEGRWWALKEIEDNLGKSVLTPNFEGEYARIKKALTALL